MGLLDWIRPQPVAKAPKQVSKASKSSAGPSMSDFFSGSFSRFNDAAWAAEYDTNARLSTPIHNLAQDVAKVQWVVKSLKTGELVARDHPLVKLLEHPHPRLVQQQFFYCLVVFYLLVGKCPLHFEKKTERNWLSIIPPHWVHRMPQKDSQVWMVQWWGEQLKEIPIDEVIYIYQPSMSQPYLEGMGLAKGIDSQVNQDKAMNRFNDFYFRNMAFLGAIVNTPGADPNDMMELWKAEKEGVTNAFKTLFLNAEGLQVENLAPKLTDLNFIEGQKLQRDFINQRFGAPPERQGILENSNRSTIEAADFHQQANNVTPIAIYIKQALNAYLTPQYGLDIEIDFIDPVREAEAQRLDKVERLLKAGSITINESRREYKYEPLKGGDVLLVPINNVMMVPIDRIAEFIEMQQQLALKSSAGGTKP